MKKLLILLMIVPTISMARTNAEIKKQVVMQFDDYMDQIKFSTKYQVCNVKLARLTSGLFTTNIHLKGTAIIAKKGRCKGGKRAPIILDIYDGEDLVIHSSGPAFNLK